MGLDNFGSSNDSDSSSSSRSSSTDNTDKEYPGFSHGSTKSGGGGSGAVHSDRWQTRLSWSTPYVLVAQDRHGNVYKHQDHLAVLDDNTDWRRLEDAPDKEYEVLYSCSSEQLWLRFCNRAQDQLGVDPQEILDSNPRKLQRIRDKVHYPKPSKPDQSRTCQCCGANSEDNSVVMVELDLRTKPRTPLCKSHTLEELAREGLLD